MGFNNKNFYDGNRPVYTDSLGNINIGSKKIIADGSLITQMSKSQVGLSNVDNTSDLNKQLSTAAITALGNKVDKVAGKDLSANDLTNTLKSNYDSAYTAINYRKSYTIFDDFLVGNSTITGVLGWNASTSGGTATVTAGTATNPGILRLDTSNSSTGRASVGTGMSAFLFGGGVYTNTWGVKVNVISDGTETYTVRAGFIDSQSAAPTDGAYFMHDNSSGNWVCKTRSNSSETSTNSNVAVSTSSSFDILKVDVNSNASEVKFYINGNLVATHTTNIPSGTNRNTGMGIMIVKSAGATSRYIDADFCQLDVNLNSSR